MKYSCWLAARAGCFSLCFLAWLWACQGALPARSSAAPFYPAKLAEMDAAITQAIAEKKCPGGVLWLEHRGVTYHKAYGHRALVPLEEPMTEDTIFDAASLTKVPHALRRCCCWSSVGR